MRIGGLEEPVRARAARGRRSTGSFALPDEITQAPPGSTQAEPSAATAALTILSFWPGEDVAVTDREAMRHGRALLDALAAVQVAQLGGDLDSSLTALATLAARSQLACDPGLQEAVQAIGVRAAVELARAGLSAAS